MKKKIDKIVQLVSHEGILYGLSESGRLWEGYNDYRRGNDWVLVMGSPKINDKAEDTA